MVASKLTPEERLIKKRQAARLRQQRCRQRKRERAAAAALAARATCAHAQQAPPLSASVSAMSSESLELGVTQAIAARAEAVQRERAHQGDNRGVAPVSTSPLMAAAGPPASPLPQVRPAEVASSAALTPPQGRTMKKGTLQSCEKAAVDALLGLRPGSDGGGAPPPAVPPPLPSAGAVVGLGRAFEAEGGPAAPRDNRELRALRFRSALGAPRPDDELRATPRAPAAHPGPPASSRPPAPRPRDDDGDLLLLRESRLREEMLALWRAEARLAAQQRDLERTRSRHQLEAQRRRRANLARWLEAERELGAPAAAPPSLPMVPAAAGGMMGRGRALLASQPVRPAGFYVFSR